MQEQMKKNDKIEIDLSLKPEGMSIKDYTSMYKILKDKVDFKWIDYEEWKALKEFMNGKKR